MSFKIAKEIKKLNKHLIKYSTGIEKQVSYSIQSMSDLDTKLAKRVIETDLILDQTEIEIEEECLKVMALHQPVAGDLRLIASVLKINNDLERIADHAVIIAEESLKLANLKLENKVKPLSDLFELSAHAKLMLRKSMLAFVELDIQVAHDVIASGHQISDIADTIFKSELLAIKEDVDTVEQHLHFLKISRQLQRIADHACNIAEDIIFIMKGDIIRHHTHSK
ncbi:MAG: phosphate signaling complex protein PhoU [Gammaproteobacteria bacterium]|nr:phosphate signaling complex protein PhoU [Gammaproteobacteria bacterium]